MHIIRPSHFIIFSKFSNICVKELREFDSFPIPKGIKVFYFVICKLNNITSTMSVISEEFKEYDDLDNLLVVPREKWAFKVSINTHLLGSGNDSYLLKSNSPLYSKRQRLPTDDELSDPELMEERDNHGNLTHATITLNHLEVLPSHIVLMSYWAVLHLTMMGSVDAEEDHVLEANAVIDVVVGGERDLHSVEVEGDHVFKANVVVEAVAGGDRNLALVEAKRDHVS
ncbi:Uncharacterized protein TCM_003057 [Theobroma cacao]|uniref:Uncharacterized protein n=1 Tax=Theobroma cacao TaxID=3641 RepID=A0A061DPJ8_THECC|nr:Uncharacterized protein TCM_003057 [Theobroma cacao]